MFLIENVKVIKKVKFVVTFVCMDKKIYLIAVAAGRGVRMGSDLPKQFIELEGKPLLRMTIERFVDAWPDVRVITVLPADYIPIWREYCEHQDFLCPQLLVEGGMTRFHSVQNALKRIPDGAVVAIHDGVRPLISVDLLKRMRERMSSCRALIPVVPSFDTLKALRTVRGADGSPHLETIEGVALDRTQVFGAQTPQMFLSEDIKSAYTQGYDLSFTDDASVAAKKQIPLSYIEGERFNIKITTPEDLTFARAVISLNLS